MSNFFLPSISSPSSTDFKKLKSLGKTQFSPNNKTKCHCMRTQWHINRTNNDSQSLCWLCCVLWDTFSSLTEINIVESAATQWRICACKFRPESLHNPTTSDYVSSGQNVVYYGMFQLNEDKGRSTGQESHQCRSHLGTQAVASRLQEWVCGWNVASSNSNWYKESGQCISAYL